MNEQRKLGRDIDRLINHRSNTVTDKTDNRLGITRGEARVEQIEYPQGLETSFEVQAVDTGRNICQTIMAEKGDGWRQRIIDEDRANMNLIADAFNVANKTGKLPSELAEDAAELLEALECMIIGAGAVAVPHAGERKVLQDAVNIAIAAKDKIKGSRTAKPGPSTLAADAANEAARNTHTPDGQER